MSINYKLNAKGNPLKPAEPKKWYANAKSAGDVTLRALGKEIAARSAVAETEAKFNASMIKNPKIAFRPGVDLKEILTSLKYTKVK